jgi:hypothetical protein
MSLSPQQAGLLPAGPAPFGHEPKGGAARQHSAVCAPRLRWRHAATDVVLSQQRDVRFELLVDIAIQSPDDEPRANTRDQMLGNVSIVVLPGAADLTPPAVPRVDRLVWRGAPAPGMRQPTQP